MPKAKPNPINPVLSKFTKEWSALSAPIVTTITAKINDGWSITRSVDFAFAKYNVKKEFRSLILKTVLDSAEKSGITIKSSVGIKDYFLGRHWKGDPLTLSRKINRLEFKQIIKNEISRNFKEGKSVLSVAKSLTGKDLTKADIPQYINRVTAAARRVTAGDAAALREFRSSIKAAGRQIESLAQREVSGSVRLKKAYQNLINKAEIFSEEQLHKAIERAVKAKARYNAERIARTEGARAYGTGKMTEAAADEDVVALKWELSSAHNVTDICDFNAGADLYGLGEGVYPKDSFPEYPAHPHCLCNIVEVFGEEQLDGKYDSEGGKEYLESLSKSDRVKMLGSEGIIKDWEDDLRGFNDKNTLPELPDRLVEWK